MTIAVIQPDGSSGIDTFVRENDPTGVYGTSDIITTGGSAGSRRVGLLKFDLSGIPVGATISSAVLYLHNSSQYFANIAISIYAILSSNSAWNENSTWNYKTPSSARWAGDGGSDGGSDAGCSVSGTDYGSTAIGLFTYTSGVANREFSVELTASAVQAWLGGENYGLVFFAATAATMSWHSSESSTESYRPRLVITYEAGGLLRTMLENGEYNGGLL